MRVAYHLNYGKGTELKLDAILCTIFHNTKFRQLISYSELLWAIVSIACQFKDH